jgi:hypothetical protein
VTPLASPAGPAPTKAPEAATAKSGRGLRRRRTTSDPAEGPGAAAPGTGAVASVGAAPTAPGDPSAPTLRPVPGYRPSPQAAPATPVPAPGISAAGPITLPGSQTPLPKEKPRPKAEPAVLPKPDTTLSFSERYRGTQYSNPDIERFLPPPPRARGRRRWARILLAGLLLVGLLAAALGGSWFLFLSPNAVIGPSASAPGSAAASVTPRPTPRPTPTINGLIADEVEIAACLLLTEDAQQQGDLMSLRTDVLAGGTPDLPARAAELQAAIETSRSSLPTLDAIAETQLLGTAWAALYDIEIDALTQIAAAPDAAARKAAVKRLDEAKAARQAVVEAHAALVAAVPEATCTIAP